jgi:impB/mucB/samB family C-terminal domain
MFGKKLTEFEPVKQALVAYVTRAAEKLRRDGLAARHMQVFLHNGVPIATEKKATIFKVACVQWARRAASRADCTAGNSRPIRVKPVRC